MPYEISSTYAPLSAEGSAAWQANRGVDDSESFIQSTDAEYLRPRFRMVAGGVPVAEDEGYQDIVRAGYSDGENWFDSSKAFEARLEARMDNGNWGSKAPFLKVVESGEGESKTKKRKSKPNRGSGDVEMSKPRYPGLKKLSEKQIALDLPPTPRGCEWRRSDEGLNLWRCWTEWDNDKTNRIKKSRYAGHLSDDAWRIMKEYDHEAFISTVGERLRRYSGR
ncbi:MAG: hypothetical protein ACREAB_07865 [Blastocatellia bacterium]